MVTFGALIERYLAWLGGRPSAVRYRQLYRQYFYATRWRDCPADQVPRAELIVWKEDHEQCPSTCRKALQLIGQAYRWGANTVNRDTMQVLYVGPNPVEGIRKPGSTSREVKMDRRELRLFLDGVEFLPMKARAFLMTRLLAPNRIEEICTMRVTDIDLSTGKWIKPDTKTGKPHTIYLPTQVRVLLAAHLSNRPVPNDYVFDGLYGRPIKRESMRKVWAELREQIGLEHIQLLDFRRTLASYLYAEIKADRLLAKAVLNHYDGDPTAIYVRLDFDKLATIIQQYADWVCALQTPHGGHHESTTWHPDRVSVGAHAGVVS